MIRRQSVTKAIIFGLLVFTVSGVALAQQGWAPLQTIKTGAPDSGINSVFYDGDEIWVVGSHGLIARSYDDGQTFNEMNQGVDASLNDVYVRKASMFISGYAGHTMR